MLVNLLTNAIYATPQDKKIELRIEKSEYNLFLIIDDEGEGMSQEVQDKIFTPFFTTKPVGEGTGLGMSISTTIIEEHNGKIDIVSEEGKGTKVTVVLPFI